MSEKLVDVKVDGVYNNLSPIIKNNIILCLTSIINLTNNKECESEIQTLDNNNLVIFIVKNMHTTVTFEKLREIGKACNAWNMCVNIHDGEFIFYFGQSIKFTRNTNDKLKSLYTNHANMRKIYTRDNQCYDLDEDQKITAKYIIERFYTFFQEDLTNSTIVVEESSLNSFTLSVPNISSTLSINVYDVCQIFMKDTLRFENVVDKVICNFSKNGLDFEISKKNQKRKREIGDDKIDNKKLVNITTDKRN